MAGVTMTTWPGGCRFCNAYQELSIIDGIVYVDIKHDPDCYSVKHDGALVKGEYRKHSKRGPT